MIGVAPSGRAPVLGAYALAVRRVMCVVAGFAEFCLVVVSWPAVLVLIGEVGLVPPLVGLAPVAALVGGAAVCAVVGMGGRPVRREWDPDNGRLLWTDHLALLLVCLASLWYALSLLWSVITTVAESGSGADLGRLSLLRVVEDQVPLLGQFFPLALVIPGLVPKASTRYIAAAPAAAYLLVIAVAGPHDVATWAYGPYYLMFNLMYIGWTNWLFHQAQILDDDRSERRRRETDLTYERASTLARRRRDAFIHDHVLSALVPAASGLARGRVLAETARSAHDTLGVTSRGARPAAATEVFASIRAQAAFLGLDATVEQRTQDNPTIPEEVGTALEQAAAEALRNCVRHAGTVGSAQRMVTVRLSLVATAHGVRVRVADDGPGFDPAHVPDGHYGIRRSIIGRMRDVGGAATVASAPGRGTVVDLSWSLSTADADEDASASDGDLPASTESRYSVQTPVARIIGLVAVICTALVLWQCAGEYAHLWVVVAALVMQVIGAVLAVRPWPDARLPRAVTVLVAVIAAVTPLMVFAQLPASGWSA